MVKLRNTGTINLVNICKTHRVYGFGYTVKWDQINKLRLPETDLRENIDFFVDNNDSYWGKLYSYKNRMINVISPDTLKKQIESNDVILILSGGYYGDIIEQLDSYAELNGIECYILNFVFDYNDSIIDEKLYQRCISGDNYIPKVIHYCWFGHKPIPEEYKNYISTWYRYNPDYQIKLWTEDNYDINASKYMQWAYKNKKWAFVSDYARLDLIYKFGGFYFDTDVEMIRNIDELRKFHAIVGFESTQIVATGLGCGCEKENHIIGDMLRIYDEINTDRKFDLTPCTVYQTNYLKNIGLRSDNSFQLLADGQIAIFPSEFLCGKRLYTRQLEITDHTFSIHHYRGAWGVKDSKELERHKANGKRINGFVEKLKSRVDFGPTNYEPDRSKS